MEYGKAEKKNYAENLLTIIRKKRKFVYCTAKKKLTGDPKLCPISWASVTWLTAGGTCLP